MKKVAWQINRQKSYKDFPFILLNFLVLIAIIFNLYNKEWASVIMFALMASGYSIFYLKPKKEIISLENNILTINDKKYFLTEFKKFAFFTDRDLPFFILKPKGITKSSIEVELPKSRNKIKLAEKILLDNGLEKEDKEEKLLSSLSRYFRQ